MIVLLVLSMGSAAADQVRLKQEEAILHKLPIEEARDYYEQLRRRAWKVRILRAVALVSVLTVFLVYKNRLAGGLAAPPPPAPSTTSP